MCPPNHNLVYAAQAAQSQIQGRLNNKQGTTMPIDTKHPAYLEMQPEWEMCRDVTAGSRRIKKKGVVYLPQLSGQDNSDYEKYKTRALFYGAASRTVQGLVGSVFRKEPVITPEPNVEKIKFVTPKGETLPMFLRKVVSEVITTGRYGVFVDSPSDEESDDCFLLGYPAESIINWRTITNKGVEVLVSVVLEEKEMRQKSNGDMYEYDTWTIYRHLYLVMTDGVFEFRVDIWEKDPTADDSKPVHKKTIIPQVRGKSVSHIPFYFVNPLNSTSDVERSPIADVCDVNISHYNSSADLEHGRHFTALPTAWVAGFDLDEGKQLTIGSQTAWVSNNTDAKAGYLEFKGQGLMALEHALKEKESLMAILGARFLEDTKKNVESFETHQIRKGGEISILASIANATSLAMDRALEWWSYCKGYSPPVQILLNTDFNPVKMSPSELKEQVAAWQAGAISWETFVYNLKNGELIPANITADEERERIENDKDATTETEEDVAVGETDEEDPDN